jgi:hypothetical protein
MPGGTRTDLDRLVADVEIAEVAAVEKRLDHRRDALTGTPISLARWRSTRIDICGWVVS